MAQDEGLIIYIFFVALVTNRSKSLPRTAATSDAALGFQRRLLRPLGAARVLLSLWSKGQRGSVSGGRPD